jgi:hypothetical protein
MALDQYRLERACTLLLQAACQSAENGPTRAYFETYCHKNYGEAKRREDFFELRQQLQQSRSLALKHSVDLFDKLNADYRARYDRKYLGPACTAIIDCIPESAWHSNLFELSPVEADAIAEVVRSIVSEIGKTLGKHPYSLATKFLHFLFPDLFVIFDSQAISSIGMWSYFALDEDELQQSRYAISKISAAKVGGYVDVMRFYRLVWHSSSSELRDRAICAATSLDSIFTSRGDGKNAHASVLDLIDKHLWYSNGNPIRLGLAKPS